MGVKTYSWDGTSVGRRWRRMHAWWETPASSSTMPYILLLDTHTHTHREREREREILLFWLWSDEAPLLALNFSQYHGCIVFPSHFFMDGSVTVFSAALLASQCIIWYLGNLLSSRPIFYLSKRESSDPRSRSHIKFFFCTNSFVLINHKLVLNLKQF
jgi:hypothetical protein